MHHNAMHPRFAAANILILLCAALCSPHTTAQVAYPAKPVTIVVPFSTGGSTDLVARMVGQAMSPSLGQP